MKRTTLLAFVLLPAILSRPLPAQSSSTGTTSQTGTTTSSSLTGTSTSSDSDSSSVILPASELQQLVAPIALYSDPLLALILPASTYPNEITQADNYLNNGGSQSGIADQDWDKSVQGLAHYQDVLHMMASNMDWTNQLGAAVLAQQSDVMAAIQAQRAKAKSLGNLVSTPQQQVVTEGNDIQIAPANPQTVYVPTYDPVAVYTEPAPVVPLVSFGLGFGLGVWADYGFNWGGGWIGSGGYYSSSFGWSWSYHSWSSSHYAWHRDWHRGWPPHAPYRPGHGGNLPPWHHHDHGNGPDHHHGDEPDHHHGNQPDHHHGDEPDHHIIHGETYHPEEQHRDRDRDREIDRDRERRDWESHRHNTKENHDRHEHEHRMREHHSRPEHHEGHRGGGHRR
jgi:hypothetical protein